MQLFQSINYLFSDIKAAQYETALEVTLHRDLYKIKVRCRNKVH